MSKALRDRRDVIKKFIMGLEIDTAEKNRRLRDLDADYKMRLDNGGPMSIPEDAPDIGYLFENNPEFRKEVRLRPYSDSMIPNQDQLIYGTSRLRGEAKYPGALAADVHDGYGSYVSPSEMSSTHIELNAPNPYSTQPVDHPKTTSSLPIHKQVHDETGQDEFDWMLPSAVGAGMIGTSAAVMYNNSQQEPENPGSIIDGLSPADRQQLAYLLQSNGAY